MGEEEAIMGKTLKIKILVPLWSIYGDLSAIRHMTTELGGRGGSGRAGL